MNRSYLFSMRKFTRLLLGLLCLLWSCFDDNTATYEPTVLFQDLQFNYNQGMNTLYFGVHVEPYNHGEQLQAVHVLYYGLDSTQTADTLLLNDMGIQGDIIPEDDVFARKVTNDSITITYILEPTDSGAVYVRYLAQYDSVAVSQLAASPAGDQGPLIQHVSMPDTMRRPSLDSIAVGTIEVTVVDPNGHEDVQTCYLMFRKPDGTFSSGSPISLYDDGNKDLAMYLWDETANDGKFSRYIVIDSNNPLGIYTSFFYARDYSGILSAPYKTTLVVQ